MNAALAALPYAKASAVARPDIKGHKGLGRSLLEGSLDAGHL